MTARRAMVVRCALVVMLCTALPAGAVVLQPRDPARDDGVAPAPFSTLVSGDTATGGNTVSDRPEFGAVMKAPDSTGGSVEEWSRSFPGVGSGSDPFGGLASQAMVEFASLGAPPGTHRPNESLRAASLTDMLKGLVTLRGKSAPGSPAARPGRPGGGGRDPFAAMLQPLAVQVLEAAIADIQPVDGRTVFSVFGGGAFVLEASRDGTGFSLSELESGTRIVIRSESGASAVASGARSGFTESARSLLDVSVAIDDEGPIEGTIETFSAAFGAVASGVRWFADSPLRLLLLLPLLLLAAAVELMRRGRSGDTASRGQKQAKIGVPEPAAPEAALQHDPQERHPRRKRRRARRKSGRARHKSGRARRKTGMWGALIRSVRASLGFPAADQLRETDYKMGKRRRSRRRAHGAV